MAYVERGQGHHMQPVARAHVESLRSMLETLAQDGIELERHSYDQLTFGSFTVVLARGHRKARMAFDGRESLLTVEFAVVQNRSEAPDWQHDAYVKVEPRDAAFAEIASNAVQMLK